MTAATERLLHHLRRTLPPAAADSDRTLLGRFTAARDEAAFAALVSRHGPMVLGVCRRVLGDRPAAEDAFQATFLTLARRAASIRGRDTVGGWLYGVAHRLALKARADEARRRRCERHAAAGHPTSLTPDHACRELLAVLDEELLRLPERHRLPLLLCYLEGQTQDEAARQLGWSLSTLRRRLERGRELLRCRMTQRGATLSAGLFAAALTAHTVRSAVPAALGRATVKAAVGTGTAPATVEALARAGLETPWLTKGKVALAVLVAAVAVADWASSGNGGAAPAEPPPTEPAAAPRPDASLPPGAVFRLGPAPFRHHLLRLTAAAFSANGKLLATAGEDGRTCVWDATTGRLIHESTTGVNHIDSGLAFAPDGKRLAVANGHGGFVVLNAKTGEEESRVQCPAKGKYWTFAAAFPPDGKPLMLFEGDEAGELLGVYDGRTAERLTLLAAPRKAASVLHVAADGKSVAVAQETSVRLLALDTGKELRTFDLGTTPVSAALSRDGRTLASLDDAGTVRLWDARTGKELRALTPGKDDKLRGCVALSPDGKLLALAGHKRKTAELFDTASGKKVRDIPCDGTWGSCLAFAPNGKTLTVAEHARLRLWDVASGEERLTGGQGHVRGAAFGAYSADGRRIVSVGWDGQVCLWDARGGAAVRSWSPHVSFARAAFSPDGQRVVACGNDEVRVFDTATGAERLRFRGETTGVSAAAYSPDGRLLALTEGKGEVVLRTADEGRLVRRLAGEADQHDNVALAFSPDGKLLAGVHRKRLRLWDVATGAELAVLPGERPYGPVAFAPDGRSVAAFRGNTLTLWAVGKREMSQELTLLPDDSRLDLHAFAFAPDGRTVFTSDSSGRAYCWELATGKERFRWTSPSGLVFSLAFAPDGRTLLTGHADGTLLAWKTAALPPPRPEQ
jgi:RNA polymerase sigma factor (sigma-70 family)